MPCELRREFPLRYRTSSRDRLPTQLTCVEDVDLRMLIQIELNSGSLRSVDLFRRHWSFVVCIRTHRNRNWYPFVGPGSIMTMQFGWLVRGEPIDSTDHPANWHIQGYLDPGSRILSTRK
jgi:hypothetical protein